jgi:hypothetical protein
MVGGVKWGTQLEEKTSPLERDMERMTLRPSWSEWEQEIRRTRARIIKIMVLVAVLAVAVACLLLIMIHS